MDTSPTMTPRSSSPLHVRAWPSTGSPPALVLLHGFTQNTDCWGPFADELAASHPVMAVDAPGHGRSAHDDADLWRSADLVAATIAQTTSAPPVVVGYSMGGRTALHLALAHRRAIAGLVLIGATAGIDSEIDRSARRTADEALAIRIETEPLVEFVDGWLSNPLFAGLRAETACRDARLSNRPAGLAASLRRCGTGNQEPLWARLGELTMPVLLIAGRDDSKFTALADRMAAAMSGTAATVSLIGGTHAVHLEQPAATAAAVTAWLAERFRI